MTYAETIRAAKVAYLRNILAQSGGDIRKAARLGGLNRTALYNLIKRFELEADVTACRGPQRRWSMVDLRV